jgi:hypothetical protein
MDQAKAIAKRLTKYLGHTSSASRMQLGLNLGRNFTVDVKTQFLFNGKRSLMQ